MIDLLPCPFCGNEAELDTLRGYREIGPSARLGSEVAIYCNTCPCDMSICREDAPEASTDDLVAELAEKWNARAR